MSIVNKISNFLKSNPSENTTDYEVLHRNILLTYILIIIAFLNLTFSIVHFFFLDKFISYFLFSYFLIFSTFFLIFRKTGNYKTCSTLSLIFITSLFLLITLKGAGGNTGILWGLTYPIIASVAFGIKKGNIFSLLLLLITIILFFVPLDFAANYSSDLKIRYISAYITILFVLQYYLRLQKQLNNNNEKKLIETQRKLYEKDTLLEKLSYQIRTPLNNIAGITSLNYEKLKKDTVEEIEISISNLITLVNSISAYSDSKALKIKGKEASFNINNTIKKSVSLFQSDKYANLKCPLFLSDEVTEYVFGDRLIFIQTILATIDFLYNKNKNKNAIIELTSIVNDKKNTFSLKISSNSYINLFKGKTNEKQLVDLNNINNSEINIIKDLVASLNSSLEIFSYTNNTDFIFNFNFSQKDENKSNRLTQDFLTNKIKASKNLSDAIILLVEDDAINSKIMSLNLKKFVNKVIIAENGKEALDIFASTKIDLILMDIRMPLMDGYKTTEKIRKAEAAIGFKTPIIAVTANVSTETKKRVFEVGMDDYTTKPVNFKMLIKKMEAQLS